MALIESLEWDSTVLGCRVVRFQPRRPRRRDFAALVSYARTHSVRLAYAFLPSDGAWSELALAHGFLPICSRVVYEKRLAAGAGRRPEAGGVEILANPRPAELGNSFLRSMALTIGATSRFFRDRRLGRKRAEKLYRAWIGNCFAGRCDVNLVAVVAGRPAGWLGLCRRGEAAIIDLVGVAPAWQGRGVGAELEAAATTWAIRQKLARIELVTEAETLGAQRFYQRRGYLITDHKIVHHAWF